MKYQPLAVTLLEQSAKANARGMQTGRATEDGITCHYYPRSKTWGWWKYSGKCNKADTIAHFHFRDQFRKQA